MYQINELTSKIDNKTEQLIEQNLKQTFSNQPIKRILLINPPDVDKTLFDYSMAKRGRCWNFPPYGLGIIASHIKNDTLKIKILNLNNEVLKACVLSNSNNNFNFDDVWKNTLFKEISKFNPDFIGISCMFTQTHNSTVNICNEIKKLYPNLPIAVGGVHITNSFIDNTTSTKFLEDFNNVDMFFLYEAESAFKQFINVINQNNQINKLYQVCLKINKELFYFSNRTTPTEQEINIIPLYELMPPTELTKYGVIGSFFSLKHEKPIVSAILSNRGCRGNCTYCSVKNFNGKGVRHRSITSIVDELIELQNNYFINHIMWLDDDFFHDTKRTLNLLNEINRQNLKITWDCTNGVIASSCTDEIIAAAAKSGCIGLNIGVESGNPQMLKTIKKPGNVDTFLKSAEVLRKYEQINTRVFLMIGFPGETYRMLHDTFNLAVKMNLDWYNISIFEPLPNTPMFNIIQNEPIVFETIRYSSGVYGKMLEKVHKNVIAKSYDNVFSNENLDKAIPKEHLEDIWFYMNYHLNFKRLFKEERPLKLNQQLKYVQYITDFVVPEDPFPMYFCGYLQKKVLGQIDKTLINRLKTKIQTSEYWKDKFRQFNLSIKDVTTGSFPTETT